MSNQLLKLQYYMCGYYPFFQAGVWEKDMARRTPWKYAFLPCGHLGFKSAVTAQNDEVNDSSYSRSLNVKT